MADARSMLRDARASRRIDHPQATYSTAGNVVCLICHIQLKSESLWEPHLRSSQHAMRLQRIWDGALGRPPGAPAPASTSNDAKKRKAHEDDENSYEIVERKKAKSEKSSGHTKNVNGNVQTDEQESEAQDDGDQSRRDEEGIQNRKRTSSEDQTPTGLPSGFFDSTDNTRSAPPQQNEESKQPQSSKDPAIDEDEWAAFERDVATPPPSNNTQALDAINASATISAPAMSAAEIASRSTEDANLHRKDRREAELEGEKEDATRQLEEEFDAMESYEAKVKQLKERREQIRRKASAAPATGQPPDNESSEKDPTAEPESSDEEDGGADGYDDWIFRRTR